MNKKIIILLVLAVLAGCSKANYDSSGINYGFMPGATSTVTDWAMPEEENYAYNEADMREQRIIQTARVNMQSNRFDEVTESLRGLAATAGGFVESANLQDSYYDYRMERRVREFTITLRIPRESFDMVLKQVESLAVVRSSNQSAEDVTAHYYDLEGRLGTKLIEEERVLDMISRAVTIEDLLALENRLGEIRTEIERFQSQMLSIDRLASFSTIHVSLSEVTTETLVVVPEGLGGRMRQAFFASVNGTVIFFQNVLIFLAGALIPALFLGVLVFVGYKTTKFFLKKKPKQPK